MYYSPPGTALIWGGGSAALPSMGSQLGLRLNSSSITALLDDVGRLHTLLSGKKKNKRTTASGRDIGNYHSTCPTVSTQQYCLLSWEWWWWHYYVFFKYLWFSESNYGRANSTPLSFLFLIITSDILYPHFCMWAHPTVLGLCGQATAGLSQGLQVQPASTHCPVTARYMFLMCKHQSSCCLSFKSVRWQNVTR